MDHEMIASGALSFICTIYHVAKDFSNVIAASVAAWLTLLAAGKAYDGVIKRINFDRDEKIGDRKSIGVAFSSELSLRARDIGWFYREILRESDPTERLEHLHSEVFVPLRKKSLDFAQDTLKRGWLELGKVYTDQREAIATALFSFQVAIENLEALEFDVEDKLELLGRKNSQPEQLDASDQSKLAEFSAFSDEVATRIKETILIIQERLMPITPLAARAKEELENS